MQTTTLSGNKTFLFCHAINFAKLMVCDFKFQACMVCKVCRVSLFLVCSISYPVLHIYCIIVSMFLELYVFAGSFAFVGIVIIIHHFSVVFTAFRRKDDTAEGGVSVLHKSVHKLGC